MRILILCTGNSCRSQMAEAIMRKLHPKAEIYSAGTKPEKQVNPFAVKVMAEIALDISSHFPKSVNQSVNQSFDYVITVCDHAKELCLVFTDDVKHRLHIPFKDPADSRGSDEEVMKMYRKVRDEIKNQFENLKVC